MLGHQCLMLLGDSAGSKRESVTGFASALDFSQRMDRRFSNWPASEWASSPNSSTRTFEAKAVTRRRLHQMLTRNQKQDFFWRYLEAWRELHHKGTIIRPLATSPPPHTALARTFPPSLFTKRGGGRRRRRLLSSFGASDGGVQLGRHGGRVRSLAELRRGVEGGQPPPGDPVGVLALDGIQERAPVEKERAGKGCRDAGGYAGRMAGRLAGKDRERRWVRLVESNAQ